MEFYIVFQRFGYDGSNYGNSGSSNNRGYHQRSSHHGPAFTSPSSHHRDRFYRDHGHHSRYNNYNDRYWVTDTTNIDQQKIFILTTDVIQNLTKRPTDFDWMKVVWGECWSCLARVMYVTELLSESDSLFRLLLLVDHGASGFKN